jgi:hypothetical protein
MNGYLHRLITRHTQEPALRLRTPSRFEDDLVGRMPFDSTSAGSSPSTPAPPDGRPGPPAGALLPGEAGGRPQEGQPEPRDPVATGRTRTSQPASATNAVALAGPPEVPAASRQRRQLPDAPPTPAPQPEPETRPRADAPGRVPITATLSDVHALATVHPSATRPSPQLRPALGGRDQRPRTPERGPAAPTAEPDVVHVHIGHIDVRAMAPPSDRLRRSPAPPRTAAMPLERYLATERSR